MNASKSHLNGPTSHDSSAGYTWVPPVPSWRLNGCHNRLPFVEARTIHGIDSSTGKQIAVMLPNRMSKDCRYSYYDQYGDPGCVGCKHKQEDGHHGTH